MSRALSSALALLVLIGAATPVAARQPVGEAAAATLTPQSPDAEIVPGQVVVGFVDAARGETSIRSRGLAVRRLITGTERTMAVVSTEGRPVDKVIGELRADPSVAFAEPDYVVRLANEGMVTVTDPQAKNQYSLDQMRIRSAWSLTTGASNVIAVLDTGVQYDHPDLVGRLLPGRDFVNDDNDAVDDNVHGTWVAGIIAANANDGYGIAGISWTDKILPVKIMNSNGTGNTSDLAAGIIWAADQGADVINMSVGGFPYAQYVQDAVNYAWNKGAVLIGAAGNNRREENFYPASFANVVSVSATQVDDEFSNWSSWGPKVDVSAPGSSVLTTNCTRLSCQHPDWGSHVYISGTSFATPNVAGAVALIRARFPDYSPQQVVDRLLNTVDDLGYPGWDKKYGRGRVNAHRALGGTAIGGSPTTGDAMEPNNTLADATVVTIGSTVTPTMHPAADVDFFRVYVPRAGRLDVRVGGIADTRAYPYHKSGLPVDPIVALYDSNGTHIKTVDNEWETGVELAQLNVSGPAVIGIRVTNWYANGNRSAYTLNTTYVDTIPPKATLSSPLSGATNVSRFVDPVLAFDEAVSGVNASNLRLRDLVTNALVPVEVSYNASARTAQLFPSVERLEAARQYRVEVTTSVVDAAGNAVSPATRVFTTGTSPFADTEQSPFQAEIEWLVTSGITAGCSSTKYCPGQSVVREQMAAFLSRALQLEPVEVDYFTDDASSEQESHINRLAHTGVTKGCTGTRYCPTVGVTRAQMATFLARALALPAPTGDYFADDTGHLHEGDINRLYEAGIVSGCQTGSYCPNEIVTREQMAAYLERAFAD